MVAGSMPEPVCWLLDVGVALHLGYPHILAAWAIVSAPFDWIVWAVEAVGTAVSMATAEVAAGLMSACGRCLS